MLLKDENDECLEYQYEKFLTINNGDSYEKYFTVKLEIADNYDYLTLTAKDSVQSSLLNFGSSVEIEKNDEILISNIKIETIVAGFDNTYMLTQTLEDKNKLYILNLFPKLRMAIKIFYQE